MSLKHLQKGILAFDLPQKVRVGSWGTSPEGNIQLWFCTHPELYSLMTNQQH